MAKTYTVYEKHKEIDETVVLVEDTVVSSITVTIQQLKEQVSRIDDEIRALQDAREGYLHEIAEIEKVVKK